jgi:hypothetical protein
VKLRCALCGRDTLPFAFIGALAIGPKCAKRAGIVPTKARKGSSVRFAKPVKRARGAQTIDMFDNLEDDDGTGLPVA